MDIFLDSLFKPIDLYVYTFANTLLSSGFPGGSEIKASACNFGRPGFDPWVGKIPWRRKWQPTPVFLPGESQGRGSLVGCRLWGRTELDTTERLHFTYYLDYFIASLSLNVLYFLDGTTNSTDLKKHEQCEYKELSFICGRMRTTALETEFQIILKNFSKEIGWKVNIYVILVKGESMQSTTYIFAEHYC